MEHARRATPADSEVVRGLWEKAVAELDGQRGGALLAGSLARADLGEYLDRTLTDPDRLITLGLIDEVAVGMASAYCERERREPLVALEVIFVEPEARQVGVAEAMINLVGVWTDQQGCTGIDAPALPGNRAAKAFFEDHGFIARLLVMHRPTEAKT